MSDRRTVWLIIVLAAVTAIALGAPNPVSALLALGVIFLVAFACVMVAGDRAEKRDREVRR